MSMQKKLILLIAFLVTIPLIVTSVFAYHYGSGVITQQSKTNLSTNSERGIETVGALVSGEKKEIESLAQNRDVVALAKLRKANQGGNFFTEQKNQREQLEKFLTDRLNHLGNMEHIFLLDTNGVIFADTYPGTLKKDVHTREYFQEALAGKLAISKTIVSKATGANVIAFAAPIKDENGQTIGVMGTTVFADYFNKHLEGIKVGESGYAYMVDAEGTMLSHPKKEKIGQPVENATVNYPPLKEVWACNYPEVQMP